MDFWNHQTQSTHTHRRKRSGSKVAIISDFDINNDFENNNNMKNDIVDFDDNLEIVSGKDIMDDNKDELLQQQQQSTSRATSSTSSTSSTSPSSSFSLANMLSMPKIMNRQKSIDLEENCPIAEASTLCEGMLHHNTNTGNINYLPNNIHNDQYKKKRILPMPPTTEQSNNHNNNNNRFIHYDRQNHFSFSSNSSDDSDDKNLQKKNDKYNKNNKYYNKYIDNSNYEDESKTKDRNSNEYIQEQIQEDINDFNTNFLKVQSKTYIKMPPITHSNVGCYESECKSGSMNIEVKKKGNSTMAKIMNDKMNLFHHHHNPSSNKYNDKEEMKEAKDTFGANTHYHDHDNNKMPNMPIEQISKIRPTPITDVDHVVFFNHATPCKTSQ